MSEKHDSRRLQVAVWELDLVKQVAHAYRSDREELEAELFRRLTELKIKHQAQARDWKAFLARSLYNAANNFARNQNLHQHRILFLESRDDGDTVSSALDLVAAPEERLDLRIDLLRIREEMSSELRDLWDLLVEERGNISAAAKKLGRPRKTVEYWIQKLRALVKKRDD